MSDSPAKRREIDKRSLKFHCTATTADGSEPPPWDLFRKKARLQGRKVEEPPTSPQQQGVVRSLAHARACTHTQTYAHTTPQVCFYRLFPSRKVSTSVEIRPPPVHLSAFLRSNPFHRKFFLGITNTHKQAVNVSFLSAPSLQQATVHAHNTHTDTHAQRQRACDQIHKGTNSKHRKKKKPTKKKTTTVKVSFLSDSFVPFFASSIFFGYSVLCKCSLCLLFLSALGPRPHPPPISAACFPPLCLSSDFSSTAAHTGQHVR